MGPRAGLYVVKYCADIQVATKISPPPAVHVGVQLRFSTFMYVYRLKLVLLLLLRQFLLLLPQDLFLVQTVSSIGPMNVDAC